MNIHIKKLTADKVISRILLVSLILLGMIILYLGISYLKLPPFVPLFNQVPWGDGRLAPRSLLLLPIGLTISIFILNCIVASRLYEKIPLLSRMLTITIFLITLLVFVYYFRIIHLIV